MSCQSSLATRKPVSPCFKTSEFPPTSVTTQGRRLPMASIRALEKPSLREGRQNTSLMRNNEKTSSLLPRKRKFAVRHREEILLSNSWQYSASDFLPTTRNSARGCLRQTKSAALTRTSIPLTFLILPTVVITGTY